MRQQKIVYRKQGIGKCWPNAFVQAILKVDTLPHTNIYELLSSLSLYRQQYGVLYMTVYHTNISIFIHVLYCRLIR